MGHLFAVAVLGGERIVMNRRESGNGPAGRAAAIAPDEVDRRLRELQRAAERCRRHLDRVRSRRRTNKHDRG
jgi:hypothetical protein